jgi:hypothetical protein
MAKRQEFQGVLYDIVEELIVERSPVLRGSYAEAMTDAKALVGAVNDMAEAFDDSGDDNTTVGRGDDSYCFVLIDGLIAYSEAEAA